ncbi:IQ motif and SEC7 domain-containing protein 2 [Bienertia sinuspersici]
MSTRKQNSHNFGCSATSRTSKVICSCGNEDIVRTVKNGPNIGTKFYDDTQCKMFKPIEGRLVVEDLQFQLLEKDTAIIEMDMLLESKDKRIKRLQLKNNILEQENRELRKGCCQFRITENTSLADEQNFKMQFIISLTLFVIMYYLK